MQKKFNCFLMCVLLMSGSVQILASEETKISYEILFDSHAENESEIIAQVLETYHGLTKSLKKKSRGTVVRQSLDKFKVDDETKVSYESGVLKIVMGDGKGTQVEGSFRAIECSPEIEASSWILEQLGW